MEQDCSLIQFIPCRPIRIPVQIRNKKEIKFPKQKIWSILGKDDRKMFMTFFNLKKKPQKLVPIETLVLGLKY